MLEVLSWWISPLLAELHGKSVLNQNMIGWPWTWNKRHQMRWMLSRWLDDSVEKSKGYFSLISNFQLSWFFSVLKMLFNFFYREGKGERKLRRNINQLPLVHAPQEMNLQPRHVPWLGIKPATFCFAGQCPTNWATPARAPLFLEPHLSLLLKHHTSVFLSHLSVPSLSPWRAVFHWPRLIILSKTCVCTWTCLAFSCLSASLILLSFCSSQPITF